ncbi:MAG TPA: zinc ribbon domain-containing protein [Longimicrobiales bacterium]
MDSVVHRLHRALAEAVASRRGDVEAEPVTVAEIYQELVPYRTVRSSVGFEMNADYEHALLRLLSGEDALVRLEPEEARSHLARELATPNPDVTLFRRYAACDVWVSVPVGGLPEGPSPQSEEAWRTPGWLNDAALHLEPVDETPTYRPWMEPEPASPEPSMPESPAQPPAPAEEPPAAAADPGLLERGASPPERPAEPIWARGVPKPSMQPVEREMPSAAGSAKGGECVFCGGSLPADRAIRYCPFCGVDQQLRPCARCGEVLEAGWRYCVNCGAPAPAGGAP